MGVGVGVAVGVGVGVAVGVGVRVGVGIGVAVGRGGSEMYTLTFRSRFIATLTVVPSTLSAPVISIAELGYWRLTLKVTIVPGGYIPSERGRLSIANTPKGT